MLTCLLNNNIITLINSEYDAQALQKWSDKNILLCPICHKPYEFCHGRVRIPYFRHKDKTECEEYYSEPETEEHLQGKIDLYIWLSKFPGVTDLILEAWLPDTKQRPDLMFNYYNKSYVIEYQCSPISTEYYERHDLYKAANISDIWICGTQKYFQEYHKGTGIKRLNTLEKECGLYYDPNTKLLHKIVQNIGVNDLYNLGYFDENTHKMETASDYKQEKINYYNVKSNDVSFKTQKEQGFKTIRYIGNKSLTRCIPLGEVEKFVGDKCITT